MTKDEKPAGAGWFSRLKEGLRKSSTRLSESLTGLFTKRHLDRALLSELEEALIAADLGPEAAKRLVDRLAETRFDTAIEAEAVKAILAEEIAKSLDGIARPIALSPRRPHVVLVVGVNGSGKTTTIGKLAHHYRNQGLRVMLAAGDTFRAAAIEQLQIWGERAGVPVVARESGGDAAGLAFDALARAKAEGVDLLLIDTAGRLQNKADLMAELAKIARVLKKIDAEAPQDCLLVLDATIGQNAIAQVETFKSIANVTGLVVTKLDGTAKGGILVALAERFHLPVIAIGMGEGAEDLRPFSATAFARALFDLPSQDDPAPGS